jgi:hypothetical protein
MDSARVPLLNPLNDSTGEIMLALSTTDFRALFQAPRFIARLAALIVATLPFAAASAAQEQDATTPQPHTHPALSQRSFTPASVFAAPGLECVVYPSGGNPSKSVHVHTNSDGYARFHAVHATADDRVRELTMDCKDAKGKPSTYPVDLTADETFAPHPLDLEREPGIDRPALTGDPLAYSDAELIQAGYGPRPDPVTSPAAYQRWLVAATLPGRMLLTKRPAPERTISSAQDPFWTGTTISGKPNYISVEGNLSVPTVIPGGDETGYEDVHVAVWNGLDGGNGGGGGGLIQGGYQIDVDAWIVNYLTFREYCCGDGDSNGYSGDFNPNPGDTVYSHEWYCDKNGNKNLTGGYGCTHLHDLNTGAILDCSSATSNTCWSVKANTLCSVNPNAKNCFTVGGEADFVIELQGPAWPDFKDEVTLTGSAYSSKTGSYSQTVANDPHVTFLNDFTGTQGVPQSTSHMNVSAGGGGQTYFNVSQFAKVGGISHPDPAHQSIAAGPNGSGSILGDPWRLAYDKNPTGDYNIYHWVNGAWVLMPGAGTEIAVGPEGHPWLVNHNGTVFYWNGSEWKVAPGNACASHIAVGANAFGSKYGSAWVLSCNEGSSGYGIYQLQGSTWVRQPGSAVKIAIGPIGPWIIDKSSNVYFWNGDKYVEAPGSPCASDIAVGPINDSFLVPFPFGDAWILGCHDHSAGYDIYQYQVQANSWVQIPGSANQISVSPDLGIPWIIEPNGDIME